MTLQQLRYVVTIAGCGSFNEAAKKLYVSQPSLSNAVKELEAQLGITIFARSNKGIHISVEGAEFLSLARQIVEQTDYVESRYLNAPAPKQHFSVSTQHYAFAVNAFIDLLNAFPMEEYDLHLRETRTYDILDDVRNLRSEIGILFLNSSNTKVLSKMFSQNHLEFTPLFQVTPHIFVNSRHPVAHKKSVTLKEMQQYPVLTFEQGMYNSLHFSEEIVNVDAHKRHIHVSDRATLFDLIGALDAYIVATGFINSDMTGKDIVAVPLELDSITTIGYIALKNVRPSRLADAYIDCLRKVLTRPDAPLPIGSVIV